jgi:thioredoxin-like negative regulator of GroEL
MKKVYRFTAKWCQPCKMLTKTLEGISSDIEIMIIDIDENITLPSMYGVRSVPTMVMVDNDQEIKRMTGIKSAQEIEQWLTS